MEKVKMTVRVLPIFYVWISLITLTCMLLVANNMNAFKSTPSQMAIRRYTYSNKTLLNIDESSNLTQEADKSQKPPIITLLVTTARSGSTWLGKLLNMIEDSFYLYEPIHALRLDKLDFTTGYKLIEQLLHCGVTQEFVDDVRYWPAIYSYLPQHCSHGKNECTSAKAIAADCHTAKYRSIKVIRLRLSLIENLLITKSLENLKVIFLVRDPRGTLSSLETIKKFDPKWKVFNAENICSKIREDVYSYQRLSNLYPNNFHLMRYEDVAREPLKKSKDMWRFINDNKDLPLPKKWRSYLKKSQVKKPHLRDPFDTTHRSTQEWQSWRHAIDELTHDEATDKCDDLIETLGYKVFDKYLQARDSEASPLAVDDCNFIPCVP